MGILTILFVFFWTGCQAGPMNETISVERAAAMLGAGTEAVLLDVRTESENTQERIPGSLWIPLHQLEGRLDELRAHEGKPIIVYCRSGNRSGVAASMMRRHGYDATNMLGGILRWKAAGNRTEAGATQ